MLFAKSRSCRPFCNLPFEKVKVTCEGDVTFCCFQSRKCLGNLLERPFEEIWFGRTANSVRGATQSKQLHPLCNCSGCPFKYDLSIPKVVQARPLNHFDGYPKFLELDLPNTHCNIGGIKPNKDNPACIMCERHVRFHPQVDRLAEVCKALRPYMPYFQCIHIQGIAEPFWKDRIFEVAAQLGLGPDKQVSSITNGTLLTAERRRRFLEFPRSTLTFSLDAATPETFAKIRRLNLYEKVLENLHAYSAERGEGQWLGITNNINILNVHEVEEMVRTAKQANVNYLEFNPTEAAPGITVNSANAHLFKDAQTKIVNLANELSVNVAFLRNLYLNY